MYKSGFDSRRMLLQQSLAGVQGGEPGDQGGESPSVVTMQQNTRLVVLTLEVSEPANLCTCMNLAHHELESIIIRIIVKSLHSQRDTICILF